MTAYQHIAWAEDRSVHKIDFKISYGTEVNDIWGNLTGSIPEDTFDMMYAKFEQYSF